ncbi:MAG: arylesterase [Mycobacterium leprae]
MGACLLAGLMLSLTLAGCGLKAKPAATPAPAVPKVTDRTGWPVVVAFGDSLTAGYGVPSDRNYPSQLQAELDRLGYRYRVVNAGLSGDTTKGGLSRVSGVINQHPAMVILELGANDGLQGLPVEQMKQNLGQLITQLQKAGAQVILAGMELPPGNGPDYTNSFDRAFPALAAQYRVPLIPFFLDGVGGHPNLNLPDGLHPTGEGYVYVVKNVLAVLRPLLK